MEMIGRDNQYMRGCTYGHNTSRRGSLPDLHRGDFLAPASQYRLHTAGLLA